MPCRLKAVTEKGACTGTCDQIAKSRPQSASLFYVLLVILFGYFYDDYRLIAMMTLMTMTTVSSFNHMVVSHNLGYPFSGSYNKDCSILGVYIGVPLFWETT